MIEPMLLRARSPNGGIRATIAVDIGAASKKGFVGVDAARPCFPPFPTSPSLDRTDDSQRAPSDEDEVRGDFADPSVSQARRQRPRRARKRRLLEDDRGGLAVEHLGSYENGCAREVERSRGRERARGGRTGVVASSLTAITLSG